MYGQRSPRSTMALAEDSIVKAQIQRKQMAEKERRLLDMLDSQQQRAMQKAGLRGVVPKTATSRNGNTSPSSVSTQAGKVRQMFEERRKGGVVVPSQTQRNGGIIGIDKSYPLEPINLKSRASSESSGPQKPTSLRTTPVSRQSPSPRGTISPSPRGYGSPTGVSTTSTTPTRTSPRGVLSATSASTTPTRTRSFGSPTRGSPSGLGSRGSSAASATPPSGRTPNRSSPDENGNERIPIPNTTKYKDYYGEDLTAREVALGAKLRGETGSVAAQKKSPPPKKPLQPPKQATAPAPVKRTGPPPPGLVECNTCHRCFASDRIEKHEEICKKTTLKSKKRKVLDSTKMRMSGTEAEPYIRTVSASKTKPKVESPKKVDWRKKHEEFISTIRAAKEYQKHVDAGGNPADLPPPPPTDTSDYTQCPHCKRKFNQAAAERHIPKCQNIKSNKR